jgi:FixJ family two-component response regulator
MAFAASLAYLVRPMGFGVEVHASPCDFVQQLDDRQSGCVLLKLLMVSMTGLAVQDWLTARGASIPIIFFSDSADVDSAVTAFRNGAFDFLQKPIESPVLHETIRRAVDFDLSNRRLAAEMRTAEARVAVLTPRERQVFRGVVAGLANKQIAFGLGIASKTVEVHRARVMEKTQARNVPELVMIALAMTPSDGEGSARRGKIPMDH